MMWEEDEPEVPVKLADDVVDLVFNIECKSLPLDHSYALSSAIQGLLPWFEALEQSGLHLIHGAASGNGWIRPEASDAVLYVSRRTRLTLRLPRSHLQQAQALSGEALDIAGHILQIGKAREKPLAKTDILFSRYVLSNEQDSDEDFLKTAMAEIKRLEINCRKLMPGRGHQFQTRQGTVFTRSLMLADLSFEDAIRLQQAGLGQGRKQGFGLFIPHKGIQAVNQAKQD
ncbi:type I-MYXAN CRISPR-associated protein Cas6/Cmx6 [Candidatus Venteria ishoeyi]|uniref:type I-MYXAN CRISPR-associated protein Cas6/Cmx6 n=1 Tax=Candidatus Venteria ishoeyi TaxID=1899563 RepID=UPI0025A56497|nr:type I-MYXAN CRISPR-associated protein Cas6/Cmx6 [Candidatus Venteria ishoeyi]MDM8548247.1 type I-MYXAN CRISPR-associated protein Cas6/Cmx6 [Candidatus Venteria ishoeyi]